MIKEKARNDLPVYLFHHGTNFHAHEFLGCHLDERDGSAIFRTWAPNASKVSVVGDWNDWSDSANPMVKISDNGIWEAEIENIGELAKYKFSILGSDGARSLKADPYAFFSETEDKTASIVYNLGGFEWNDGDWMKNRYHAPFDKPVNIYEVHAGSWRRLPDGSPYSYIELAREVIPYIKEMGYTHIELMPLMEYSDARQWGYQTTGYFSATSRYGTPKGLMTLIDECHAAGIGVILDWVPAHFAKDSHGLIKFDGSPLYEAHGPLSPDQWEWGTEYFDYARAEVQSFLISNALFWIETYHADGLRVSDVSSMLYHQNSRNPGEFLPNANGGNENLDAIAFIKKLNKTVLGSHPGVMMIAEESKSWPMVTHPVDSGGLGFNFKWNIGWTNDMLEYVSVDPLYRKQVHEKVTFSFYYAFSENFILSVSHDETVYGKRSLIDKMPGTYEQKFAGVRAFLGYVMTHPGKKLSFMGNELAQFKEWDYDGQVDWSLLSYPDHQKLRGYVKELNRFYLETPQLWEVDYSWDGFQWISADDREQNIIVFLRMDKENNFLVVVQNFAPVTREDYCFGVPEGGDYEEAFNSDRAEFGGSGTQNGVISAGDVPLHGFGHSLKITVPPLSTVCFRLKK